MRIAVLGYHNIGCRCLEVLIRQNQNVVAVFTHQDDPKEKIWFDSVADLARAHGIPCHLPDNINDPHWVDLLRPLEPDLIFSFYFRQMLSREILKIPPQGAINLHGSYLPAYRGRCPVNWVLVNGEKETGVTLHYMVERPDAGDIIARARIAIALEDTALTLFEKMEKAAVRLLKRTLPKILTGTNQRIPQDLTKGSYFGGRRPDDGRIDWMKSGIEIYNLIRAVTHPYPGAFTFLRGKKVFVWKAKAVDLTVSVESRIPGTIGIQNGSILVAAGQGAVRVLECQVEGGPELQTFDEMTRVFRDGERFDQQGSIP
ncbi:MAG: formyltransferase [Thermodesulfobacteriota bacterium]